MQAEQFSYFYNNNNAENAYVDFWNHHTNNNTFIHTFSILAKNIC